MGVAAIVSLAFSIFFWGWSSLVAGGHSCHWVTVLDHVWDPSLKWSFNQDSPCLSPGLAGGPSSGVSPVQDTPTLEALCHGWFWHSPLADQIPLPPLPPRLLSVLSPALGAGRNGWPYSSDTEFWAHFPADTPTLRSRHLQTTLASLALKLEGK